MTAEPGSKYDRLRVSVEFTHNEWSLLLSCVEKRRRETHDRADRLELADPDKNAPQVTGLRRKATALFVLTESIQSRMADVRCDVASNAAAL